MPRMMTRKDKGRKLMAIVGPGGFGKTAFAAALCQNKVGPHATHRLGVHVRCVLLIHSAQLTRAPPATPSSQPHPAPNRRSSE